MTGVAKVPKNIMTSKAHVLCSAPRFALWYKATTLQKRVKRANTGENQGESGSASRRTKA